MKNKTYGVTFLPFNIQVEVPEHTSILDAARRVNLSLKATCGGEGTCGDCAVQIIQGKPQSKSSSGLPRELMLQGYSLACQTEVTENLTVKLPQFDEISIKTISSSTYFDKNKKHLSGVYEILPPVKGVTITSPPPTLEDNYGDLRRLERELRDKFGFARIICEYSVLKKLADAVRKDNGKVNVIILEENEKTTILDILPTSQKRETLGVACDIGTSTVVLHLVDLQDGSILHTASAYNQQIKCGEDIISRINYARTPERLEEMHDLIVDTINRLIDKSIESLGLDNAQIYFLTLAGNTTMTHLFLKLDPRYIREEPYVPTINSIPMILARDLDLHVNHEARVFCSPSVGSYVGGDITSGLLCTPIMKTGENISLFIDAGTNGELVLGNQEWLMTCACSAGPAFEGRGISCGMPAVKGAIDKIGIDNAGRIQYSVIEDTKPQGVCGSGLVDLLAGLFIHGFIDRYGKFIERKAGARMAEVGKERGFLIEESRNSFWGKDLIITEKDISSLIRTKGAIYAACSFLLKKIGLTPDKIGSVFIAGGFGQSLDIENSIHIGLLPDLDRERIHYIGNSSLSGTYFLLLSRKNWDLVDSISRKMTYTELNTEPAYMNEYTGALFLPHTEMDLFPSVKKRFLAAHNNSI